MRGGWRSGDDVIAMFGIRGEQAVIAQQMHARARHQGGKAGDKVQRLKQHVGDAVRERVFEFVDHKAIPVDTQALKRNGPSAHVAAKSLELLTLMVFASRRHEMARSIILYELH